MRHSALCSMHRPQRRLNAQHNDQPFDLAPAAEVQVVTDVAAGFGAIGGLQPCGYTEPVDQRFGFDNITWFDI